MRRPCIAIVFGLFFLFSALSLGQSIFTEQQQVTTDFFWRTPNNICPADLDGDNDQDILVANYGGVPQSDKQIVWYKNLDGAGNFGSAISIPSDGFMMMTAIHAADLDGDGDLDFVASDDSQQLAWFKNLDGRGNFGAQKNLTSLAWHINAVRTADFDLDGDLDIVGVSINARYAVFWFENQDGNGTFGEIKPIYSNTESGTAAVNLAVADMDGDGDTDIVASAYESDITKALYIENLRNGSFKSPQVIGTFSADQSIIVADLDRDNDADIVVPATNGLLFFENADGHAEFSAAKILASTYTGVVFPDDLDNDGDVDLLWIDLASRLICYYNNGSGSFRSQQIVSNTLDNPGVICTADFDHDGDRDILIGAGRLFETGSIIWFENAFAPNVVQSDQSELPETFQLFQNHPNPFNPSTTIRYNLPDAGTVTLTIHDLAGREIETLIDGFQTAGDYQVKWVAEEQTSGIYFARLQSGTSMKTIKLLFQK